MFHDTRFKIGTMVTLDSPEVAELLSRLDYDFLLFDMEHSALSTQATQRMVLASGDQCSAIVRVPDQQTVWIKRILDTGCDGIVVPMVKSRAEVESVVRSAKYGPLGERSVGISRAHGYGAAFGSYVAEANSRVSLIIQVEHVQAVREVVEILKVPGIDAVMIGPYDLSASMGLLGQIEHPEVRSAIHATRDACRAVGTPVGIFTMSPESVPGHKADGFDFVVCGIDTVTLNNAAAEAVAIASQSGPPPNQGNSRSSTGTGTP